ncbi:MAG: peptidoglycan DD-metalloendopeptidase family protein [Anaerolineales bacterium]|nr:peptidoglycan DD-metalloendopeptidase family protein [Anaerolineales bacterium]
MKWTSWRRSKAARALLGLAAAVLLAAPLPSAQAQSAGPTYIVQAGDGLAVISNRFGVTIDALVAANPALDPNNLQEGAALTIPGSPGLAGTVGVHPLEQGETLASLGYRFGQQRATLVQLNGVLNSEQLYFNQPIIYLVQADGALIATGRALPATSQLGLVGLGAAYNQNPYALAAVNQLNPARLTPGTVVFAPGGDRPLLGLPAPITELLVGPLPAMQGSTLSIRVTTDSAATLAGTLGAWPLTFNADPGVANTHYAMQGLPRFLDPDLYPLVLTATLASGAEISLVQRVPTRAGDFLNDGPLTVDPATIDPAVTAPENDLIAAAVAAVTPERLWLGPFVLPSIGVERSVYGSLRVYNGGALTGFHTGVDYSGQDGQPITAPAAGVVVLAQALTVRGNATIIDHGWGVYTGYWHQSVQFVAVGDGVEAGQVIGENGHTGRVTGPHLHWEMFVAGVQVDPRQFVNWTFP